MRASVHVDLPGFTKEGVDVLKARWVGRPGFVIGRRFVYNPSLNLRRCEELKVQPRGTRGESGGQTGWSFRPLNFLTCSVPPSTSRPGITYDISNKHRLGYSEVELVQCMIDGVNTLVFEDRLLQRVHGINK